MKSRNNKFCEYRTLRNESDVEQFLVQPLLSFLGYTPSYLKTKTVLPRETIGKGSNRKAYVPDYLGYTTKRLDKPVIVVDAKHPNEPADQGVLDAQLYASVLRRRIKEPKPDQFCIGCNGDRLIVRHYDSDVTLHSLDFDDLKDGNSRFTDLFPTYPDPLYRVPNNLLPPKILTIETWRQPNYQPYSRLATELFGRRRNEVQHLPFTNLQR